MKQYPVALMRFIPETTTVSHVKLSNAKEIFTICLANQIPAELAESVQLVTIDKFENTQKNT